MLEFIGGFVIGIIVFIGYGAYRATNSDGWDDSNINNWLRLLSHCYIHPEDFGQMYYLSDDVVETLFDEGFDPESSKPFNYINKDEFAENFPDSRPR